MRSLDRRKRVLFPRLSPVSWFLLIGVLLSSLRHAQSDNSVTIGANDWIGNSTTDWFDEDSWYLGGGVVVLPQESLPTQIGPSQLIVNGIPAGFIKPVAEAIVRADFSTPDIDLIYFDGPCILTITDGATFDTNANVGQDPSNNYIPIGEFQNAELNLSNAILEGTWNFTEWATVNVLESYDQGVSSWTGQAGILNISSGKSFTLNKSFLLPIETLNQGQIQFTNSALEKLWIDGEVTLSGGGEIILPSTRAIQNLVGGRANDRLVNFDNTIRGTGSIITPLRNQGTIRAEGGILGLDDAEAFESSTGTLEIASDGVLRVSRPIANDAPVGRLAIETGGRVEVGSALQDVELLGPGPLLMPRGIGIVGAYLIGEVANSGTIGFEPPGSGFSRFIVDGEVRLTGGGEVVMNSQSVIEENFGDRIDDRLVNVDHVIRGIGSINAPIRNQGTIRAEGGTLGLNEAETFESSTGTLEIASDGVLRVSRPIANDAPVGRLAIETGGRIELGSVLQDVELLGPGPLLMPRGIGSGGVYLIGEVSNSGTIGFEPPGSGVSRLFVDGEVRLMGGGEVVMNSQSHILGNIGDRIDDRLVNLDHTIRGFGSISVPVVNQGVIRAEGSLYFTHSIDLPDFDNETGTLNGGQWEVVDDGTNPSSLNLNRSVATRIIGPDATIVLEGAAPGSEFVNLLLESIEGTLALRDGFRYTTPSDLALSGRLELGLNGGLTDTRLIVNGNIDFTGGVIDVSDFGLIDGVYRVVEWTGSAIGVPTLANFPRHKGISLQLNGNGLELVVGRPPPPDILSVSVDDGTGEVTIRYVSVAGVSLKVFAGMDLVNFMELAPTEVGDGSEKTYTHTPVLQPSRYFYKLVFP